jgi:hypothetical protein
MAGGSSAAVAGAAASAAVTEQQRREEARSAFKACTQSPSPQTCKDAVVFAYCRRAVLDPMCETRIREFPN